MFVATPCPNNSVSHSPVLQEWHFNFHNTLPSISEIFVPHFTLLFQTLNATSFSKGLFLQLCLLVPFPHTFCPIKACGFNCMDKSLQDEPGLLQWWLLTYGELRVFTKQSNLNIMTVKCLSLLEQKSALLLLILPFLQLNNFGLQDREWRNIYQHNMHALCIKQSCKHTTCKDTYCQHFSFKQVLVFKSKYIGNLSARCIWQKALCSNIEQI